MKKIIIITLLLLPIISFGAWYDFLNPFTWFQKEQLGATWIPASIQIGTLPANGDVLQTNGTISTWVATSSLGFFTAESDIKFSTTSANYWESVIDRGHFYSTTSAIHLLSQSPNLTAGTLTATGTISLPANSITDAMVSNTLTASDLVTVSSVVSDSEVDNDITSGNLIASTSVVSNAEVDDDITVSNYLLLAGGNLTGSLGISSSTPGSLLAVNGDIISGGDLNIGDVRATGTITGNLTGNVTGNADTATNLSADPANCSVATEFAVGITAAGVASCEAIVDADVPDTITASNYLPLAGGTMAGSITSLIAPNPSFSGTAYATTTYVDGTATSTFIGGIDVSSIDSNNGYSIANSVVLTSTRLGAGILGSSLTSVGTLTGGATGAGFTVNLDTSTLTCTNCIDISANTDLTAGRSLTLTDDDIAADEELFTFSFSINVASTSMSTTTQVAQHRFPVAITLKDVACSTDRGTSTINFDERASSTPNTAGGANVLTTSLQCGSGHTAASSVFTDSAIAAFAALNLQITDASPTGLKPTILRIHGVYIKND